MNSFSFVVRSFGRVIALNSAGIKSSKTLAQIDLSSVDAVQRIIILLPSKRMANGN